ncbi:MAG TPA: polyprenyl diphosphate synthase [Candidatus Binatia bacterium]|nr:polyprenyl diphosphate synthase [Candidatus Binatia bacterium]
MSLTHLALILDGNRRWAKANGLPTLEGHRRGYDNLKTIGLAALERGMTHVSAFVFSTENWNRSAEEVSYLMDLLYKAIVDEVGFFMEHDVRLKVVGSRERLSDKLRQAIDAAEVRTAGNGRGQMNLCLNYGGRAEIVEAARALVAEGTRPEAVTEAVLAARMWTAGIPDPDLIVRTSGEHRLSGFLTWSGVYSELLFVDKHWPDFTVQDLEAAIEEYGRRERRYGK